MDRRPIRQGVADGGSSPQAVNPGFPIYLPQVEIATPEPSARPTRPVIDPWPRPDYLTATHGAPPAPDTSPLASVRVLRPLALWRVPTRFVQKYTLRARLEPSGAHEAIEGSTGHARELGDGGFGNAQLEEAPDVVLLAVEP